MIKLNYWPALILINAVICKLQLYTHVKVDTKKDVYNYFSLSLTNTITDRFKEC